MHSCRAHVEMVKFLLSAPSAQGDFGMMERLWEGLLSCSQFSVLTEGIPAGPPHSHLGLRYNMDVGHPSMNRAGEQSVTAEL